MLEWRDVLLGSACNRLVNKSQSGDMLGSVKIIDTEDEKNDKRKEVNSNKHGRKRDGRPEGLRKSSSKHTHSSQAASLTGGQKEEHVRPDGPMLQREDWMTKPMASRRERNLLSEEKCPEDTQEKEKRDRFVDPSAIVQNKTFTVGDGGASWRMKALKRAQVQAQIEGKSLTDVVGERWSSVSDLANSADKAAPANAHHRSKIERRGDSYLSKGKMRRPTGNGQKSSRSDRTHTHQRHSVRDEYSRLVQSTAREINGYKNDGSFMEMFTKKEVESEKRPPDLQDDHLGRNGEDSVPIVSGNTFQNANYYTTAIGFAGDASNNNNISAAAMLRAKLSGKAVGPAQNLPNRSSGEVVLPMVDSKGRAAPGAFGRESTSKIHETHRPQKRVNRYEDGQKARYFDTDDTTDLDTMVKRSKHGLEDNMDDIIARNIAKRSHFKDSDINADDEYDFDAGVEFLESHKASKQSRRLGNASEEMARKEKQRQVRDYQKMSKALGACKLCLSSPSRPAFLAISMGTSAYLALPDKGRLAPGHCCIIPSEHLASSRLADETTWEEMRNFKKCVLQMFADKGQDCIFFETALKLDGHTSHTCVECIPVHPKISAKAPMYFKKAIDDATADWSQHAAKRCIETESRHLQKKIPANFPYVHIEFGLTSGFVHVIDNPKEFDPMFARRVLVGLLGLPEEDMHRRISKEGESVQRQWAEEFKKAYKPYDWVSQLT